MALPSGTVTLMFTDVEGSTTLVKALGGEYESVLGTHRQVLRDAFMANDGIEIDTQGDAFFVVFAHARDAVAGSGRGPAQVERLRVAA